MCPAFLSMDLGCQFFRHADFQPLKILQFNCNPKMKCHCFKNQKKKKENVMTTMKSKYDLLDFKFFSFLYLKNPKIFFIRFWRDQIQCRWWLSVISCIALTQELIQIIFFYFYFCNDDYVTNTYSRFYLMRTTLWRT